MHQPEELKKDEPLLWSTGRGTDVWALFCACIQGDLAAVKGLIQKDPALVRCHHNYRKPLYFAVRENRIEIATFLLDRDPDPTGLAVNDSLSFGRRSSCLIVHGLSSSRPDATGSSCYQSMRTSSAVL
jgi:Ankyrin repeats (3 copies)